MKRHFFIFSFIVCGLCGYAQSIQYNISGTWKGEPGEKVYLGLQEDKSQPIDSVILNAGNLFRMSGMLDGTTRAYLYGGKRAQIELFLDGTPVETFLDERGGLKCKGSQEQEVLDKSKEKIGTIYFFKLAAMLAMSKEGEKRTKEQMDSLVKGLETMQANMEKDIDNYLDSISDSEAAPYFIQDYHIQYLADYEAAVKAYEKLSERVKQSATGQRLAAELQEMSQYVVGGTAPDFTSTTPEGKPFNLYSLRGHVVLIDFWASWCGPCLREVPTVKKVYDKYHEKGLEILGVSLDRKREPWLKAIEEKGLNWHHVSSLKEFEDPVARQFHVTAIPRMFILDENGKIIAQDLRGEALIQKMDELFADK